jgi:hypothetical protein
MEMEVEFASLSSSREQRFAHLKDSQNNKQMSIKLQRKSPQQQ